MTIRVKVEQSMQSYNDSLEYCSLGLNIKAPPSLPMCPPVTNSLGDFSQTPHMGPVPPPNWYTHRWVYGGRGNAATPNVTTGVKSGSNRSPEKKPSVSGLHSVQCDGGEIPLITISDSDEEEGMVEDSSKSNDESDVGRDPEKYNPVRSESPASSHSLPDHNKVDFEDQILSAEMPGPWRHEYVGTSNSPELCKKITSRLNTQVRGSKLRIL